MGRRTPSSAEISDGLQYEIIIGNNARVVFREAVEDCTMCVEVHNRDQIPQEGERDASVRDV
jgi:hypothetical protein